VVLHQTSQGYFQTRAKPTHLTPVGSDKVLKNFRATLGQFNIDLAPTFSTLFACNQVLPD
jgi:hypothetical protein